MSKRKKRGYKQLINKKEQISRLINQAKAVTDSAPIIEPAVAMTLNSKELSSVLFGSGQPLALPRPTAKELWRTLISSAIITVILITLIIFSQRSEVLTQLGQKLYSGLDLGE